MSLELYRSSEHLCMLFSDLVTVEDGEAVQANQCLIVHRGRGMLLDPGGNLTYSDLLMAMGRHCLPKDLDYLFASHADPDIVASLPRWMLNSQAKVLIPSMWARFVPHFSTGKVAPERIIGIGDRGGRVHLNGAELIILPAHYLHAEGNLQVYDPTSKLLFSGDLGTSVLPAGRRVEPVTDFERHIPYMQKFHTRYMVCNRALRLWADMVSGLDIAGIVPQHGAPMLTRALVRDFIAWVRDLRCGTDLLDEQTYRVPGPESLVI